MNQVFEPMYNRVVLEIIKEEMTENGLFIPKTTQEKEADRARVVAVGKGKYDVERKEFVPMLLKEGDVVFINPYLGMRVKASRDTFYIVQQEDEVLGRARA